jgi:hypothetical protein
LFPVAVSAPVKVDQPRRVVSWSILTAAPVQYVVGSDSVSVEQKRNNLEELVVGES